MMWNKKDFGKENASSESSKLYSQNSSQGKGILKTRKERGQPSRSKRRHKKTTRFDESNIESTYHPFNKDYGHDKIEEPPTPYYHSPERGKYSTPIDAAILSKKLTNLMSAGESSNRMVVDENGSDFQKKMKQHYKNEVYKKDKFDKH